jgi:RNA polymerase sigma factor (TIGR02999 family)
MSEITVLLEAAGHGDSQAAAQLLPLVYEELRKLAAAKMASENPCQTLQATALVHEAWLRLAGDPDRKWNDRSHFFAAAAEAMRRILVDIARRKRAQCHGGGQLRIELPEISAATAANHDQLLAVNDALERFAQVNKQKAELVKLRYFVGMTTEEAAQALGISVPTASRYWVYARAWLAEEIRAQQRP